MKPVQIHFRVIEAFCQYYEIDRETLFQKTNKPIIADKRHLLRKILRESYTLKKVGYWTGCSYMQVIDSIKRADNLIMTEKSYRNDYYNLMKLCGFSTKITTIWQLAEMWKLRLAKLILMSNRNPETAYLFKPATAEMISRMINIVDWAKKLNLK